jgi:hypothetical protein
MNQLFTNLLRHLHRIFVRIKFNGSFLKRSFSQELLSFSSTNALILLDGALFIMRETTPSNFIYFGSGRICVNPGQQ